MEDLHCTWPFCNMSEPSFVCYSSGCNWMFVWIFLQGCKKSHVLIRTGRKLRSAGWASICFFRRHVAHWVASTDRSLFLVRLFWAGMKSASGRSGWWGENVTCAAATAALQIVLGHQSSAFNCIRQRNGWVGICCLTPASCAVKVTVKAAAGWLQARRKEGRREGLE